MASSTCNATELESYFLDFYCEIISAMYDMCRLKFLQKVWFALKHQRSVTYSIDKREEECFFAHYKYEKPQYRCAYLYAYSLLHTTLVHHHFANYVQNNRNAMIRYFPEKELKICCLGGGPGIEAVAICKVINDLFLEYSTTEESSSLDIYITVIDICEKWETEVLTIVNRANKCLSLFDSKKVTLHAKFLQANLLNPFDPKVQEEIEKANVISMIKLASSIKGINPTETNNALQKMIMRVAGSMEKDSCIILLDIDGVGVSRRLMNTLSKCTNSVFEMMLQVKHTLNIKSLLRIERLVRFENRKPFPLCIPTRITTVSSCFCIRKEEVDKEATEDNLKCSSVASSSSVKLDKSGNSVSGEKQAKNLHP